jgi:hypothetical protein
MKQSINQSITFEEDFWVLEFIEGQYKGQYLYITEHHQNIVGNRLPMTANRYKTEDQALTSSEKHSWRYKSIPKQVKLVCTVLPTEEAIVLKPVIQNVLVSREDETIKVQFNFCPECKYFTDCYPLHAKGPRYISEECATIGKDLGYDL